MESAPLAIIPLERPPVATVRPPGSKSHTNRALVCAGLARGRSRLTGILFADDTEAMLDAWRTLEVHLEVDRSRRTVALTGTGGRLPPGPKRLDVRQSGTTGRFLLPVLTLGRGPYELDGHAQLRARPFGDLIDALAALGAGIEGRTLPLTVAGPGLSGGEITVPGSVSSQFLSGLLLAAPAARGSVTIRVSSELVSKPYVELTVSTMRAFGAVVEHDDQLSCFEVSPSGYEGVDVAIEPDASAASYFFAAAVLTGGRVRVEGLSADAVQGDVAFVRVLEAMGADVTWGPDWIEVSAGRQLRGVEVDMADFSDTAQTLAVVATAAEGPTRITGIGFIRRKETDRIGAVVAELRRRGIEAVEEPDGIVIQPGVPTPGVVNTYDDHRMAMSFALLGLAHPGIEIADPGCVAKTYPEFFQDLDQLRRSGS